MSLGFPKITRTDSLEIYSIFDDQHFHDIFWNAGILRKSDYLPGCCWADFFEMIPRLAKRAANAAGKGIFWNILIFWQIIQKNSSKFVKIESCLRFDAQSQLKLRLVLTQVNNYKSRNLNF